MPKFSDSERAIIHEKLLTEGERLFIRHGLRKVTVDDLVNCTGIAKGSFYAFYKSKEHLYAEILFSIQNKVLAGTEIFLKENSSLNPKELIIELITWSYDEIEKYPMMLQHDYELWVYLVRKLPKDVLDRYSDLNIQVAKLLAEHGVKFKYETDIVVGVFQALSVVYDSMMVKNEMSNNAVMDILVNGIVNEIVEQIGDDI